MSERPNYRPTDPETSPLAGESADRNWREVTATALLRQAGRGGLISCQLGDSFKPERVDHYQLGQHLAGGLLHSLRELPHKAQTAILQPRLDWSHEQQIEAEKEVGTDAK